MRTCWYIRILSQPYGGHILAAVPTINVTVIVVQEREFGNLALTFFLSLVLHEALLLLRLLLPLSLLLLGLYNHGLSAYSAHNQLQADCEKGELWRLEIPKTS
jgi:hypothetical protein